LKVLICYLAASDWFCHHNDTATFTQLVKFLFTSLLLNRWTAIFHTRKYIGFTNPFKTR